MGGSESIDSCCWSRHLPIDQMSNRDLDSKLQEEQSEWSRASKNQFFGIKYLEKNSLGKQLEINPHSRLCFAER